MERPKTSAGKAKWIAYADHLEATTAPSSEAKIAELEAENKQLRADKSQLKRRLQGQ